MFSKLIVSNALGNLRNISKKYYVDENSFIYVKKLTPENVAGIIMNMSGSNINSEARSFIKRINDNWFDKVSGSGFCQRRQQLRPEIFQDENKKLIREVYKQLTFLHKYNGKTLLAADSSIITLSNHTITKEKYGTKSKIDAKNIIPRARIACITDTLTNMIISADITIKKSSEPKIAAKQINELKDIINLKESILVGDRGYDGLELIINLLEHKSNFIIRLKESTFKKERKNLRGKDEIVYINMTKGRLNKITDQKLKNKYLKEGRIPLRIIKIALEKEDGTIEYEYLITNLFKETAPYEDFKELYHQRWSIETEFDRLKNIHEIENFSGRKEICIKQDFYAKILTYNMTMTLKQDAEKLMTRKISKNQKRRYQINTSTALSLFKDIFIKLLKSNNKIKEALLENLITEMIEDLSSSLIDPPNTERIVNDITNKFPGNIKRA
ncbi:MAG: IS4 family transposase [Methanosphaera sp.]|nr:IS4 family transposase [Methanosphaera sp.]